PSVAVGKTLPLSMTGTYSDSSKGNLTTTIWASLDRNVATISTTGVVTGVATGTVTIRATHTGIRDTVTLTVTVATLDSIAVTPATPTTVVGNTVQFVATGTYSDSSTANLTTLVTWASSDTSKATIAAGGLAASQTAGSTTITATLDTVSGNTTLTVTAATLQSITVTPASPSVVAGRTQQFMATGTYSDASTANLTALVTWTSSDTSKATIAAGGLATSLAAGTTQITATKDSISGSTTLTVTAAVLDSIAVTPANPSVAAGRTQQFVATGTYSDASTANITTSVTWSSSSTGVASISTAGLATAVTQGTATITATSGSVSGNTMLTVTAAVLDSIAVTPASPSVAAGRTQQFVATGTYSDASTANITTSVTWSSSSTGVASISTAGLATSYSSGGTTITATKSSVSGTTTLTVSVAVLDTITVAPTTPTIRVGDTLQFQALGTYSDGSIVYVTASASWDSDSASQATIASGGLGTGVAAGTTQITATLNSVSGSTVLTVTNATLQSITVTPAIPSVAAGRTKQFVATGTYSDASTANLTVLVTWSSSDNNTAMVYANGLATSYTPGTATITATKDSVSGSTTLTVTAAALESITVTPIDPSITFISGGAPTLQFTTISSNSDGSTSDVTSSTNWTSSDTSVATIGPNTGLVTTVGDGTTTITATYSTESDDVTLTVLADTVAPVVTLTSPSEGLTLTNKTLTVSGSLDDTSATASVTVNGVSSALTLSAGNFNQGVLLNTGSNTVLVSAVDGAGNTGLASTITVEVDPNKPAITISSPSDGTLTNSSSTTVTGTITNATSANLIFNGATVALTITSGSFSQSVTLTEGVNVIVVSAYATGHSGDSDYLGTSGARRVTLDTTAPVVTVESPISGAVVNAPGITVSGVVDDPNVTSVTLTLNGGPQSIMVVGRTFSQNITLAPGSNTINVVATDATSNTSSGSSITVSLDTSKPGVTITTPSNRLLTNTAGQTVAGTVSDPAITSASLYLNGSSQSISVAPDGSFSKLVTLNPGANTIEVRATDAVSNIGTSGVVSVTLDSTLPTITIGLSDPTDSITITVTSNEALTAAPTVTVNPTITMNAVDVNQWSGTYGSTASPISAADYTVSVTGTDKAGNSSTKTATFTKETIDVDGINPTSVTTDTTTLQIETHGDVSNADISVTQHLNNPSGNVGNPRDATVPAGAFVEIVASPELRDNLKQIYIRVDYTEDDLPAGTDEASLRLYLWDLATGTWQLVPGSGVNTVENYIYGTVTHLSKYGGFGSISSGMAGGGGGPGAPPPGLHMLSAVQAMGRFTETVVIMSDDNLCKMRIAKGTIGLMSYGRGLTYISMVKSKAPPSPPTDSSVVGVVYDFRPDRATFEPPIITTITYDPNEIPEGVNENNLVIAMWDSATGNWVELDSTVDPDNNTITAPVSHFTAFTIVAFTRPAAFTTRDLSITPTEVEIGQEVTISILVTNTGDLTGSHEVGLNIDSVVVETQEVRLDGGDSKTVIFKVTPNTAGERTVNINSLEGTFKVQATSPAPPPPALEPTPPPAAAPPAAPPTPPLPVVPSTNWWQGVVDNVSDWWEGVTGNVSGWWEDMTDINSIRPWWSNLINSIRPWWNNLIENISPWWSNLINSIRPWWSNLINSIRPWWNNLIENISPWWSNLINSIRPWWSNLIIGLPA
ncbi:Ig-like domain-containing protein, partial [Chloroflexota bacterium]